MMRVSVRAIEVTPYKHRVVDGAVVLDVVSTRIYERSVIISCASNVVYARRPNDLMTVEIIDGNPDDQSSRLAKTASMAA